jgi:hypothetical protein
VVEHEDRRLAAVVFTEHTTADDSVEEVSSLSAVADLAVLAEFSPQVAKPFGTGAMAAFNGVGRALAAARTIQERSVLGSGDAVAIGVAAGEVVVDDSDVHGLAVVEAARLRSAAHPGQVLVSALAFDLAGVDRPPIRPYHLKGFPQPMNAAALPWEPAPSPAHALGFPPALTPPAHFVGRAEEIAALEDHLGRARSGRGSALLVAGESGIGKTTLIGQVLAEADDLAVLYGRVEESGGAPHSALARVIRHVATHDPRGAAALGEHAGELHRIVPDLSELYPHLAPATTTEPESDRRRLTAAVVSMLAATAADLPTVVVLDDLQWASADTIAIVAELVEAAVDHALLIIGTYRPHEFSESKVRHLHERGAVTLPLRGLTDTEVSGFVSNARPGMEIEARTIADLMRRSNGNPWLLNELATALDDGAAPGDVATEPARHLLLRRIERLAPDAEVILRAASVVGLSFDPLVLVSMLDVDLDHLIDVLEDGLAAGLLVERAGQAGVRFEFAHALTRDFLYDELSGIRRSRLHQQAGHALEATGAANDVLARHFAESVQLGDHERAIRHRYLAGVDALGGLADNQALESFVLARQLAVAAPFVDEGLCLDIEIGVGEAEHRLGLPSSHAVLNEAARAAERLGDGARMATALMRTYRGSFNQAFVVDEEAVRLLTSAVDLLAADAPELRTRLLARLAVELSWSAERDRVRRIADDALAAAEELGDPGTTATVLSMRLWALYDDLETRVGETERLLALVRQLDDPELTFEALDRAAFTYERLADGERLERVMEEVRELARKLDNPATSWNALRLEGRHAALHADRPERIRISEVAFDIGRAANQPDVGLRRAGELFWIDFDHSPAVDQRLVMAQIWRRYVEAPRQTAVSFAHRCLELGMEVEAREIYATVRADIASPATDHTWLWEQAQLGLVAAALGSSEERDALRRCLEPFGEAIANTAFVTVGSVARPLGLLALSDDDQARGVAWLEQACNANASVGAVLWLARSQLDLADVLAATGSDPARVGELRELALAAAVEHRLGLVHERATVALGG